MTKLVLVICALIPSIFGQCTLEKAEPFFSRSVYEFSIELVKRVAQDNEYHFVVSTLSPWTLLSCISLGAEDVTLQELSRTLRLHPHQCFNKMFYKIAKNIVTPGENTTLYRTSAVFVDDRLSIKEIFQKKVHDTGISEIKPVAFDNFEYVAAYINDYVSSATNGAIDEVVLASDLENVSMLIVDALRFKGLWKTPFNIEDTEESAFYDEMENKIGNVDLMFISGEFKIKSIDSIGADVVELPYTDNKFSMLLFVPYSGHKVSDTIHALKDISLKSILQIFNKRQPESVNVQMPRFKTSSDLNNMKELLIDMGLRSMFDSQAQFSDISDYPLYVSNLIQKANIEVTEEGTVGSAATSALFTFRAMPRDVNANKPFFYMIVDKKTEIPLFAGAYSKPSLY